MDTYSKCYKMVIFGVKYRLGLIHLLWQPELHAFIGELVKQCGHTPLKIGGVKDHVHILYSEGNTGKNNADTMEWVKSHSSSWVNKRQLCEGRFGWQKGYAIFTYPHSALKDVSDYIVNQDIHHRGMSYREEIQGMLQRLNISPHENGLPDELE